MDLSDPNRFSQMPALGRLRPFVAANNQQKFGFADSKNEEGI